MCVNYVCVNYVCVNYVVVMVNKVMEFVSEGSRLLVLSSGCVCLCVKVCVSLCVSVSPRYRLVS